MKAKETVFVASLGGAVGYFSDLAKEVCMVDKFIVGGVLCAIVVFMGVWLWLDERKKRRESPPSIESAVKKGMKEAGYVDSGDLLK